jgi:hypothetical protein
VARDSSGNVKYTRDEKGCHPAIILSDTILYLRLIPSDFDTVLLAKCVGNGSMVNGQSIGDGTVQNYGKQNIDVGVKNHGEEITDRVRELTKKSVKRINNAAYNQDLGQVINLPYVGDINEDLGDGCTVRVQSTGRGHHEDLSENIVYKSNIITVSNPNTIRSLFAELTQATTGLRWDAGYDHIPYIGVLSPFKWKNDGERAIQINNLLPPGFKLSTEKVPGVVIQEHPNGYDPNPSIDNPFSLNPLNKTPRLPRTYIKQAPTQKKESRRR